MEIVTQDLMHALIGQKVEVHSEDGERLLSQLEVSDVAQGKIDTEEYHSFSISLKGDTNNQLPQDSYLFKHSAFGEYKMFMSIYDHDKYQIVISRRRDQAVG
ncbi:MULTISPECIES: DUF6916 family protein [Pseudoalteromonas]|uniref:DUF6916 domain-containing protein n=1 Tax=Pseudoalteromonas luteoviolacea (strain 2ta16) TaxID=1353533 RepID=V4HTC7_PSEL2|nr:MULTISPECIES: hypothetical protein [Pseudoalteromonas]ESP91184.1 hypothetical protein PL2TA16_01191 [Pseudoalteromonas luteoviolacea 2ta16]KZN41283.1 hypothetical protein N483_15420 [Pseudoalteromonas luteoviolacea NCIMB 1944]MCG7550238.1 hypothetical protein [Pseudoalteromonas sp. Of7M-16]